MRGAVAAALGLIALQVALSTPLAGLLGAAAAPAQWARSWMDPTIPLIRGTAAAATPPPNTKGGSTLNTSLPPGSQGSTGTGGGGQKK